MDNQNEMSPTNNINSNKRPNIAMVVSIGLILVIISVAATYLLVSKNINGGLGKNNSSEKLCSGMKVSFFAGGPENDVFAGVIYNGAKQAENDLGVNVKYIWSNWDSNIMVSQLVDEIATSPDAIAIMGHPGSAMLKPFVEEAERKNIIITAQNVDLPDLREKYESNGFGYVGQRVYESGLMVSNAVVRKYNPAEGSEAIVFGVSSTTIPSRYQRTKGCVDGLKNANLVVHEITVPKEIENDLRTVAGKAFISESLAKYPNAKIIIADHHESLINSLPSHLKELGKAPGEIKVAGFDLSTNIVAGIRSGYIDLVLDQQQYLQGYLPILQACLSKKYGFTGLDINTGTGLIDKSNIEATAALAEKKIR